MNGDLRNAFWADKQKQRSSFFLFLIGLFGATQVVCLGAVGISELVVMLIAPIVFYYNARVLRNDGFGQLLLPLSVLFVMLAIGSLKNDCFFPFMLLKKWAMLYSIMAHVVVYHCLLRGNFRGLRWWLLGGIISGIIKIWYFNPAVDVSEAGDVYYEAIASEDALNSPVFWSGKLRGLFSFLLAGWYQILPIPLIVLSSFVIVGFVATGSVSGRGAMATLLAGVLFIVIGRKSNMSLGNFTRKFFFVFVVLILAMIGVKQFYSYAAKNGILGDDAYSKYMRQTKRGNGIVSILMAGRVEFFVQARAILDKPLLGYGVLPYDKKGYYQNFIAQYGDESDMVNYLNAMRKKPIGMPDVIKCHSHIMTFWMDYGVLGLFFWLYIIFCIFKYFSCHAPVCPLLFGYMAIRLTGFMWDILFNPLISRSGTAMAFVLLFLVRALYQKRYQADPYDLGLVKRRR